MLRLNRFKNSFLPLLDSMMSTPDDIFHESIDSLDSMDALALAAHIEQLPMAE